MSFVWLATDDLRAGFHSGGGAWLLTRALGVHSQPYRERVPGGRSGDFSEARFGCRWPERRFGPCGGTGPLTPAGER